jgi:hypothetical protein
MMRRIIFVWVALAVALAPLATATPAGGAKAVAGVLISAACHCQGNCDHGACRSAANCAQVCAGTSTWMASGDVTPTTPAAAEKAVIPADRVLTGLDWPPLLQPPIA